MDKLIKEMKDVSIKCRNKMDELKPEDQFDRGFSLAYAQSTERWIRAFNEYRDRVRDA